MINKLSHALRIFICAVLTLQLIGCGTIMHPERKGQKGGKIDAGIAVLDGLGLLFFLIPGIIAFAVDFNNGTIYLPGTSRVSVDTKDIKQVKFDPKHSSMASIAKIIKEETGQDIAFDQPEVRVSKLESIDDMMVQFAQIKTATQNDKIALLN